MDYLHKEVGETLQIRFLPYQRSMWDSMESIFDLVKESETDTAYLSPIIWIEKASNIRHEDNWQDMKYMIDYESKCDVVITHYPYDNNNYITDIDKRYYTSNLKRRYGKDIKIVYVPYFVVGDNIDVHFILQDAVIYADYVVVESEYQKDRYIDVLTKHGIKVNPNKFLPFGNPKYDAVDNPDKYMFDFKHLENISKDIVLLNTGLLPLMQNDFSELRMLRKLFDAIKEEDMWYVLWRPHPLINTMIRNHRTDLQEEYYLLQKHFVELDIGIIDTSYNFQGAIAVSDLCITDPSSLVHLYRRTGKPMFMLYNLFKHENENDNDNEENVNG